MEKNIQIQLKKCSSYFYGRRVKNHEKLIRKNLKSSNFWDVTLRKLIVPDPKLQTGNPPPHPPPRNT